jgi:hypothetical protein
MRELVALLAVITLVPSTLALGLWSKREPAAAEISVADLDRDIRSFLDRQMAAHLADIHSLNPPQQRVGGALTTGEYTWGTFMRSFAAYTQLSGATSLAGKEFCPHRHFEGPEGRLAATLTHADWPYTISVRVTGNAPDGRGRRGPLPRHLEFETRDLVLRPDAQRGWKLRLQSTEAP